MAKQIEKIEAQIETRKITLKADREAELNADLNEIEYLES